GELELPPAEDGVEAGGVEDGTGLAAATAGGSGLPEPVEGPAEVEVAPGHTDRIALRLPDGAGPLELLDRLVGAAGVDEHRAPQVVTTVAIAVHVGSIEDRSGRLDPLKCLV